MLISHAKWRSFTELHLPPGGTAGHMLKCSLASHESVDAMSEAALVHGGRADVNPVQDLGFMSTRDLTAPDGNLRGVGWIRKGRLELWPRE
ncbi:hypothetical protein LNV23_01785 [Paucibacter sp. DJ1R-11]|uniref:VOC family protein n=1 Tax=Paucibacter sp. DJ1R-11 TaxID=2893556 RepID=UPI0021E4B751|nr:hypothetical protein [Paucibacter sp. DJ1R-11]MCV2362177.1 hypothetical protein [Paucibacter sp. DJ1R-11]